MIGLITSSESCLTLFNLPVLTILIFFSKSTVTEIVFVLLRHKSHIWQVSFDL